MENGVAEVKPEAQDVTPYKQQVEQYLTDTDLSRPLCERDRDYKDHKQWTADEEKVLRGRNQAPIVDNRVRAKVEGLVGLYMLRKTDPKAYARTQAHEKASQAITDALRYVADDNDLDTVKMECADEFWVEGTCAAIIEVKQKKNGEIMVTASRIPWDRFYYDTNSRKLDFTDARFKGLMLWMGIDEGAELFKGVDFEALLNAPEGTDETFEDRPRWTDKKRKRVRIAYHFYIKGGVWSYCIFSGDTFLVPPQESPFLDDDGEPCCPIEAASANIDRDNNRYGEVRGYIPLQDEINHRRSKFLHLLSQRQTYGRKGDAADIKALKKELSKPDGHIEFNGDEFGKTFGVMPTGDMADAQLTLLQEAKAELDAIGFNAQLAGERQKGDLSGVAINRLQQAGTIELNRQTTILSNWEKRVYRQIWARAKQFWNEEKWIRVTDDQDNLQWVGLNAQVTAQEWLEQQINDDALDIQTRRQAAASYQFLMAAAQGQDPQLAQIAKAKLEEIVEVKHPVPELDMDIILDQSYDVINVQQEQFDLLVKLAQNPEIGIPGIELIRASQLRGKDELIDRIEKAQQAQGKTVEMIQKIKVEEAQAKNAETMSKALLNKANIEQTQVETQLMLTNPPQKTQLIESA